MVAVCLRYPQLSFAKLCSRLVASAARAAHSRRSSVSAPLLRCAARPSVVVHSFNALTHCTQQAAQHTLHPLPRPRRCNSVDTLQWRRWTVSCGHRGVAGAPDESAPGLRCTAVLCWAHADSRLANWRTGDRLHRPAPCSHSRPCAPDEPSQPSAHSFARVLSCATDPTHDRTALNCFPALPLTTPSHHEL